MSELRDLTRGGIPGGVWYLGWPIVLASLLQVTMQLADTIMVGHLGDGKGTNAVAALAGSTIILLFVMTLGMAISTGTAVLVARRTGEGQVSQVARITINSFWFTIVICILVLTPTGLFLTKYLTAFLKMKGQAAQYMAEYLNVSFAFIVVMFLFFIFNTVFRGAGDSRTSLVLLIVVNAVNFLLNWIFIYGHLGAPAMEVKGAAVATVIARTIGVVASVIILWKHPRVRLCSIKFLQFDLKLWWRIFIIGFPSTLQAITRNGSNMIVFRIVSGTTLGVAAAAAYGVGIRVMMIPVFIGLSFMQVGMALVGQNLGAKNVERAKSAGNWTALFSVAFGVLVMIIMIAIPEQLTMAFIPKASPEATKLTVNFFYIVAGSIPFLGYLLAMSGSLRGAGATVSPLLIDVIARTGLLLPLAWILSSEKYLDANGIWIAISATTLVQFALIYYWWQRGSWKKIQL